MNICVRQFRHEGFVDSVAQALQRHGADPRRLRLELREGLLQDNPWRTLSRMVALKELGVGFVVDDFGIGFSSLSPLKRLPLYQISAVGVETLPQRDLLLQLGCSQWQGDFFGTPAPMQQFEARLAAMLAGRKTADG